MNDATSRHPAAEELLDLTFGDLDPARAHEIREHLLACSACLEKVRQMVELPDEEEAAKLEIGDAERAAAWKSLSAELGLPAPAEEPKKLTLLPGGSSGAAPQTIRSRRRNAWDFVALAASATLGVAIGFLFKPEPLEQIRLVGKTPLASSPPAFRGGEPEKPKKLECPPPGGDFVATITFPDGLKPKTVYFEIRKAGGELVESERETSLNGSGSIDLLIPSSRLPDGHYLFKVRRDAKEAPIEEIPFEVNCPP